MASPTPRHHPRARPAALALVAFLLALMTLPATALPVLGADRDRDGLRDAFEQRYGLTRPGRADSDRDGVIDSAEDLDGDRLGNLGEQRFGTHPGRRDSDADGTPDGAEDADRDGVTNAWQQDARPIPAGLTPSLSEAHGDRPISTPCNSHFGDSRIHPCIFGDTGSDVTIVLFGDSHAAQWLPPLRRVGREGGWRIVTLIKGGCPSAFVVTTSQYGRDLGRSCEAWQRRAIRWLRETKPDLVIVSNLGRYDLVREDGSVAKPVAERESRWLAGLVDMLGELPARSKSLVLADTPSMLEDPVACLVRHPRDLSACAVSRLQAVNRRHVRTEQRAATTVGATFANLSDKVCSYDPCPLVQGNVMMWRDMGHLTATFSRKLAPSIRDVVESALAARARSTESQWPA